MRAGEMGFVGAEMGAKFVVTVIDTTRSSSFCEGFIADEWNMNTILAMVS